MHDGRKAAVLDQLVGRGVAGGFAGGRRGGFGGCSTVDALIVAAAQRVHDPFRAMAAKSSHERAHHDCTGLACGGNPRAAWGGVAFPGNEVNADDECAVGSESR